VQQHNLGDVANSIPRDVYIFTFSENNFVTNLMSVFWQKIFYIFIGFDLAFIFKTLFMPI